MQFLFLNFTSIKLKEKRLHYQQQKGFLWLWHGGFLKDQYGKKRVVGEDRGLLQESRWLVMLPQTRRWRGVVRFRTANTLDVGVSEKWEI